MRYSRHHRSLGATLALLLGIGATCLQARARESLSSAAAGRPLRAHPIREEIRRGPPGRHRIALTFDAGGNADCFNDLIGDLQRARVHSTFFITGEWSSRNPDCVRSIVKQGHEIGNHTWSHFNLTKVTDDVIREEILRAESVLTKISGQTPRPRWRAPFGERDERVLRITASLGYQSIYWTIDSMDSIEPPKTPEFLIERITNRPDSELDGAIILMHVGEKSTAAALPAIIGNLQGRGFRLVTISDLLR